MNAQPQYGAKEKNAADALKMRESYVKELETKGDATRAAANVKGFSLLGSGDCMVTTDARTLLSQCADVAKGARFYVDNWDCEGSVAGGEQAFATACLGLIGFALDAIDAHYCALDEEHQLPRDRDKMTLKINYSGSK